MHSFVYNIFFPYTLYSQKNIYINILYSYVATSYDTVLKRHKLFHMSIMSCSYNLLYLSIITTTRRVKNIEQCNKYQSAKQIIPTPPFKLWLNTGVYYITERANSLYQNTCIIIQNKSLNHSLHIATYYIIINAMLHSVAQYMAT